MNDTFNLRRFVQLAYKHYWENKMIYMIFAISTIVIILLTSPISFLATRELNGSIHDITGLYTRSLNSTRMLLSPLFFYAVASFTTYVERRRIKLVDRLLPCSNFERYLFIVLNSTVIALLAYFVMFYGTALFIESHIYANDHGQTLRVAILDFGRVVDTSIYHRVNIITPWMLLDLESLDLVRSGWINSFGYCLMLFVVLIAIWNNLSFRKSIWGLLLHVLIFGVMLYIFIYFVARLGMTNVGHINFIEKETIPWRLLFLIPLMFIPAYIYSSYQKLKRL